MKKYEQGNFSLGLAGTVLVLGAILIGLLTMGKGFDLNGLKVGADADSSTASEPSNPSSDAQADEALKALEAENAELKARIDALDEQNQANAQQTDAPSEQPVDAAEQIAQLKAKEKALIAEHEAEIDGFRSWLEKLNEDGELTAEDSSSLASELKLASDRISQYKAAADQRNERIDQLRTKLDASLSKVGLSEDLGEDLGDLIAFPLSSALLFNSGSATLTEQGRAVLSDLGEVLSDFDEFDIVVGGHTDNQPIKNSAYSNWELSAQRAVVVVREIVGMGGVESSRLSAVGFGEFRPVASNDDAEGRAKNRRVELRILARP